MTRSQMAIDVLKGVQVASDARRPRVGGLVGAGVIQFGDIVTNCSLEWIRRH